ncbi:DUF1836 domain-containing protein [Streptococcus moroccensis]|uniref:DUF1836 domain-containing protein n=1 Tax=Streptococcus moroccensis TaxID=1451356 RepID=A0ABT9YU67_9STRE|nr:DUF1836 domain-containing protein [Streptococcus moroccensis]MDQ0222650.1 hypothetical protein [Streptococcus moroccensis]
MKMTSLPYWKELPTIDLYLDQVLLYVNELMAIAYETSLQKPLTASMINNYVKHGYVQKPFKKKYGKHQIGQLVVISLLKEVFSIQELTAMLQNLSKDYDAEYLYDAFIHCFDKTCHPEERPCPQVISLACQTVTLYHQTTAQMLLLEGQHHESK